MLPLIGATILDDWPGGIRQARAHDSSGILQKHQAEPSFLDSQGSPWLCLRTLACLAGVASCQPHDGGSLAQVKSRHRPPGASSAGDMGRAAAQTLPFPEDMQAADHALEDSVTRRAILSVIAGGRRRCVLLEESDPWTHTLPDCRDTETGW